MWDPRTYVDTDFGLDDDESFEPDDISGTVIDTVRDPHIMTVLGAISPDDLGMCLPFEHLLIDPPLPSDPEHQLTDVMKAIEELTHCVTVGGQAIVDATTRDEGRDVLGLRQIARLVPAHVVTSTGGQSRAGLDVQAFDRQVQEEIIQGIGPRQVRPGVIVATLENREIEDYDRAFLRIVAGIGAESRLPVYLKMSDLANAVEAVRFAIDTSLPEHQLNVVIPGVTMHSSQVKELLALGVSVICLDIGKGDTGIEAKLASAIADLVAAGNLPNILLSHGFDLRKHLLAWNGAPGWIYMLERFVLTLMDAGLDAPSVRTLLVENPKRALTIAPEST